MTFQEGWLRDYPCNVLVVHYEALHCDLENQLRRVGHFLGVSARFLHGKHMQCILNNASGRQKRHKKQLPWNPFTAKMNETLFEIQDKVDGLLLDRFR